MDREQFQALHAAIRARLSEDGPARPVTVSGRGGHTYAASISVTEEGTEIDVTHKDASGQPQHGIHAMLMPDGVVVSTGGTSERLADVLVALEVHDHPTGRRMEPIEFVAAARRILAARGENEFGRTRSYHDDRIIVRSHYNGLDLEITRKPMRHPDLSGSNPVTMVKDGIIIRHHGEHAYVVEHLEALDAAITAETAPGTAAR